jgi:hypothetical protein
MYSQLGEGLPFPYNCDTEASLSPRGTALTYSRVPQLQPNVDHGSCSHAATVMVYVSKIFSVTVEPYV